MKGSAMFLGGACVASVAALALGLSLIDSPSEARLYRIDEQKVEDLRRISLALQQYRRAQGHLPDRLAALGSPEKYLSDPVTQEPYAYTAGADGGYTLCAVFDRPSREEEQDSYSACNTGWRKHPQGRYCFSESVKTCP